MRDVLDFWLRPSLGARFLSTSETAGIPWVRWLAPFAGAPARAAAAVLSYGTPPSLLEIR